MIVLPESEDIYRDLNDYNTIVFKIKIQNWDTNIFINYET